MAKLSYHFKRLGQLAGPLAVVHLSNNLTGAVDTAMAGRVDKLTLGATGLGASIFILFSVAGMASGLGCDALMSQALGRGETAQARRVMWQGMWVGLSVAAPLVIALYLLASHLERLGVHEDVAYQAGRYLYGRAPFVPAHCAAMVLRSYLQAARATRPVLWASVSMNLFNIAANWLLLWGDAGLVPYGLPALGLPALGVFGLGLASGLASVVQLGVLAAGASRLPCDAAVPAASAGEHAQVLGKALWQTHRPLMRRIFVLGVPAGLQMLAEVGVFTLVSIAMGGMGPVVAAAHQTAIILVGLAYSVCVGIGSATSVYVGRAAGTANTQAVRWGGVSGILWAAIAMTLSALMMWLAPEALVRLLTDDLQVQQPAVRLLRIAGLFQIADGAQAVATGALRGLGQTSWPLIANVAAYYGLALPLGLYLAYRQNLGPEGLWWGLCAGLGVVSLALCLAFWRLSGKPVAPLSVGA
jgi:MATE family multidrug resistance protein